MNEPIFRYHSGLRPRSTPEALARYLRQFGTSRPPDGDVLMTYNDLSHLYRDVCVATGDEMVGLWSRPLRLGSLRILLRTLVDAPTLREALIRYATFFNVVLDDFSFEVIEKRHALRLELHPHMAGAEVNPLAHTLIVRLLLGICQWLCGCDMPAAKVSFSFPPSERLPDIDDFLSASVECGSQVTSITFHAVLDDISPISRFSDIAQFVERAPRVWFSSQAVGSTLKFQVREMLMSDFNCTMETVASGLNISVRTLIRRLRANGLTFRDIRDELRLERSMRDLIDGRGSLDEIAYALGFSSSSVFNRAFRRWTGMSPGAYRAMNASIYQTDIFADFDSHFKVSGTPLTAGMQKTKRGPRCADR